MPIPLYSSQFALLDFIGRRHALRLERNGLAKVIRHKKTGANLFAVTQPAEDPKLAPLDMQGNLFAKGPASCF